MLILDTNHLRALMIPGAASERLLTRLEANAEGYATTIVNVQEILRGWFDLIHRANAARQWVQPYSDLLGAIHVMADWPILPFDVEAARQYDLLQRDPRARLVDTMDKRIAAIALSRNAIVLTQNRKDFERIPNLITEDWLLEELSDEPLAP